MQGGHNRLPAKIKELRGTLRPDRDRPGEPSVPIKARCPRWLSADGKRVWRYLVPRLVAVGVLHEGDLPALAAMCAHYGTMLEAARVLERDGLLIEDKAHGTWRKNPAAQILRESSAAFRSYAAAFGLTPLDRERLMPVQPEKKTDIEEFLEGKPSNPKERAG